MDKVFFKCNNMDRNWIFDLKNVLDIFIYQNLWTEQELELENKWVRKQMNVDEVLLKDTVYRNSFSYFLSHF